MVAGAPSADVTIEGSLAAGGAGTDAGSSQLATPAQSDGAGAVAPAVPEAAQLVVTGEGGAAGEGETAGEESFEGVYVGSAAANLKAVLSTAGSQFYSGASVELASANGTLFQWWRIESVGEGYYTITSVTTDKVLDVANGGSTPGTNVWQCTPFGNDVQKWYPKYAGDQSFSFVCKGNGLALDIADGIAESGTNVQVYTRNNSIAQRFVLTPTTYVLDDFSDLLAHFSTVSTNTFNGWYNMSRALSNFDGMVVWPGETVSFFDTCGPCGAAEGYLIAGVVGGSGYGGGICQASTTLYGAVVRAGLTIVERQNHTTPSTYVPIGQDAMVNWGSSDFRFRNDWDFPVKIVVDNYDRTLNCDIWGIQPDWYDYIDVSSWWTGSHSAAAQREYYKDGVIVATSALPNSWYW
ncbi:VanW family protein [Ellagibacter isourolithinifaciens]|uniref:VanW family protein n=1 Tax=Ellagibacter isourolithinifaciens TaxID=2137581 RepID=UPI003FD7DEEC